MTTSQSPTGLPSRLAFLCLLAGLIILPQAADAQSFGDRLLKRAKQQVDQRLEQAAQQTVDQGLDATEDAIRCAVTDADCIRDAQSDGREVVYTDASGGAVDAPRPQTGQNASRRIGEGAWAN